MAVYQPTTNWDDVNARGGVAGTTQAPATTPYDPNAETTTTDWSRILGGGGVAGTTTPPTTTTAPTRQDVGIADAYKKYLGRDISADEYSYWRNVPNYEQGIAGSAEATAYANRQQPTPSPSGDALREQIREEYRKRGLPVDEASVDYFYKKASQPDLYSDGRWRQGWNPYLAARMINRSASEDPALAGMDGVVAAPSWYQPQQSGPATQQSGTAFSDPATQQWEQLVRQLTDRLNNPMPESAKELQQTQALDPLERQRQTMKQQTAQRLSQRGITPTSGTWDEAMREVDRQFNELRTRTQAGFANTFAQNDENRMLQATNLFKQIPQYQDTRLELARNTLIPTNVGSLLDLQQRGNQWTAEQQQAFTSGLIKAISDLLSQSR